MRSFRKIVEGDALRWNLVFPRENSSSRNGMRKYYEEQSEPYRKNKR